MSSRILTSCALLALAAALPAQLVPVPLNYNFNGIVHAGEAGLPDSPTGYRSISDRGLDFSAGVPNDPLLVGYAWDLQGVDLSPANVLRLADDDLAIVVAHHVGRPLRVAIGQGKLRAGLEFHVYVEKG